jgi:predicted acylesterase/phospholipase RssA
MTAQKDVAVVLSGGGMNGLLLELGFLKRLRESELWPRVGWFFGSSAGALNGCMAALDRLAELEEFILRLRPEETFRANRLWRLPLLGTHDYVLPRTIAERLGDPVRLAEELHAAEAEVVAIVTDVTLAEDGETGGGRLFERAYSSRTTPPREMAQAVLASAAISALVLPIPVGDRIGTDGGWVRNYPLGYAYERPEVELIVAFRYEARYPQVGMGPLRSLASRLSRYSRVPAVRALIAELQEAAEREARGQPAHIVDLFSRLTRVAIMRNTALEEIVADWRDQSVEELQALRADIARLVEESELAPGLRDRLGREISERFEEARFPFRHDRHVPRITVAGSVGEVSLEPGFRKPRPWTADEKRHLIDAGYELTDVELRAYTKPEET